MPVSSFMNLGPAPVEKKFGATQLGFISYVVLPYFKMFLPIVPEMDAMVETLRINQERWKAVAAGTLQLPASPTSDFVFFGADRPTRAWLAIIIITITLHFSYELA